MSAGNLALATGRGTRIWRRWLRYRRAIITIGLWYVALNVTLGAVDRVVGVVGLDGHGRLTIEKDFHAASAQGVVVGVVALALASMVWGQIARLVDYRWFDGLSLLIPIYGFWWVGRIIWRLLYRLGPTGERDWPPASVRERCWVDPVARRLNPWST